MKSWNLGFEIPELSRKGFKGAGRNLVGTVRDGLEDRTQWLLFHPLAFSSAPSTDLVQQSPRPLWVSQR
jgi:hypothetical protein